MIFSYSLLNFDNLEFQGNVFSFQIWIDQVKDT